MATIATLVVKIVGDASDLADSLGKTQGIAGKAVGGLSAIGGGIVMGALGAATAAATTLGVAAWKSAETIDEAYDTIQTQTGATGETLQTLQDDFDTVFKSVPTDAGLAADVISGLNQKLGLTGPTLDTTSIKLLNMTRLLGGDAKNNAALFGRTIQDAGLPVDQAGVLLDKLFVASQKSGLGVDTLMQSLVQFGAPMRNMGFDLDTSIALFAKWSKEGVNAELVMGSLRIAATKFAKDNIPLNQGLADAITNIKGAKDASEALTIAQGIFGSRAAGDMAAAIREGRFDIDDMRAALLASDGAINKNAASTADWGEKWMMFTNKLTLSLSPIGDVLREVADGAMDMLNSFAEKPEVQTALADLATWIRDLSTTAKTWLPQIGNWFKLGWAWLLDHKEFIVAALAILTVAIVAWAITSAIAVAPLIVELLPVIGVLLLIGLVAAILYLAWTQNWGGIQEKTAAVWAWLEPVLKAIYGWFAQNIPIALEIVRSFVMDIFLPAFVAVYRFFWTLFITGLRVLWAVFTTLILPVLRHVAKALGIDLNPAFRGLHSVVDGALPLLQHLGEFLGDVLLKALLGIAEALVMGTKNIDTMTNALNNLKLPPWLTPGSPTPWEIGLLGINDAMDTLTDAHLPALKTGLQLEAAGVPGLDGVKTAPALGPSNRRRPDPGAGAIEIHVHYHDNAVVSSADEDRIADKLGPAIVKKLRQYKLL